VSVKCGLLTPSVGYKPFRYPWAYEYWKAQQSVHWMPEEVNLNDDVTDWAQKLNGRERSLLTHIFRYFTQADIEVNDNYMDRYSQVFKPTEVKMMLSAFSNMETIHIAAYSLVLETIGMPETTYSAFMDYEVLRARSDYMKQFGVKTDGDILRTVAMFGAFSEGLQLYSSFAMMLNFPRREMMKAMGQIISWSVRDESLHCEGMIRLYHAFAKETGALTPAVIADINQNCREVVEMEDKFIDLAFEEGPVEGLSAEEMKAYIRHVADWRLEMLRLPPLYGRPENPLKWLPGMIAGVEHANFFETRSTEYSKGQSRGTWREVRRQFDMVRAAPHIELEGLG
jgi:ribonucleoside-diphosphate reductase beta chain